MIVPRSDLFFCLFSFRLRLVQRDPISISRKIGKTVGNRERSNDESIAFEQLVARRKSDREVRRSRNDSEEKGRKRLGKGRGDTVPVCARSDPRDSRAQDRSGGPNEARPITTISPILRIHPATPGSSGHFSLSVHGRLFFRNLFYSASLSLRQTWSYTIRNFGKRDSSWISGDLGICRLRVHTNYDTGSHISFCFRNLNLSTLK